MNVIKAQNLKTPAPSAEGMQELWAGLAALAGKDDPLTVCVCAENWPGRQAVHCVYYVGLRTLTELKELDESKLGPITWRFFAGGHKTMTTATGCMATWGSPGLPIKVMAVTRGAAQAQLLLWTEMLNELSQLSDNLNNQYELRVLRIPALGMEAFWLKSLSAGLGDLVVPYGALPGAWNSDKTGAKGTPSGNQVYSVAEFLKIAADMARLRLAKPDIAPLAHRPRARPAPVERTKRPSMRLPKSGSSPSGRYDR